MASRRNPSFQVLLSEMRSRDALKAEGAFHFLLPRASEHIEDLLGAFELEKAHGVRCWLLELIGEARTARAFDVLRENAVSEDDALRGWAIRGLHKLGTPSARTLLWELGSSIKIGAVICDSHRRVGIVCSEEPAPPRSYIRKLVKSEEITKLGATRWWGVAPLSGGCVLEAEPLMVYLREATYDDFFEAADCANAAGRERLVKLFPNFATQFLARQRPSTD